MTDTQHAVDQPEERLHVNDPRRKSKRSLVIGVVVVLVVAVLVGVAVLAAKTGRDSTAANPTTSAPTPFVLKGKLTLTDYKAITFTSSGCRGKGGYDDIAEGASVTVYDDAGKIVAKGSVVSSKGYDGLYYSECVLNFEVPNVPPGFNFYSVEVTHRGKVTFSAEEARSGVALTLG